MGPVQWNSINSVSGPLSVWFISFSLNKWITLVLMPQCQQRFFDLEMFRPNSRTAVKSQHGFSSVVLVSFCCSLTITTPPSEETRTSETADCVKTSGPAFFSAISFSLMRASVFERTPRRGTELRRISSTLHVEVLFKGKADESVARGVYLNVNCW